MIIITDELLVVVAVPAEQLAGYSGKKRVSSGDLHNQNVQDSTLECTG